MTSRINMIHLSTARAAITAGLGLTLALGNVAVPVTQACAATETGTITISQTCNKGASYKAYQLFSAHLTDEDTASSIEWASSDMKNAVLSFLDAHDYGTWLKAHHGGEGQHDLAQNAAEYIAEMIGASETISATTGAHATTAAGSFATELAQQLAANDTLAYESVSAGTAFTGPQGYWLFVTDPSSAEGADEAATAPIWLPLGGKTTTINEKTAIPHVEKSVQEDSTGAWGSAADANMSQEVHYRLSGTLPQNFDAFETYAYTFTDSLSKGLAITVPKGKTIADVLTVKVNGNPVEVDQEELKATYANQVLTVSFANLKSAHWKSLGIKADSTVTVDYTAHLTSGCAQGVAGNSNSVTLTYTNDPVGLGEGKTSPTPDTKLFCYGLRLTKLDDQTNEALSGAKFTISVSEDNSDASSVGSYVQKNGSLGKKPYTFVTGEDGSFTVQGLDEGTYLISELEAPEGYERLAHDLTVTLTRDLDTAKGAYAEFGATLRQESTAANIKDSKTKVTLADGNTGRVDVAVGNNRLLALPITGLSGIGKEHVAGAFVAAVTGAGLLLRRRMRAGA